MSHHTMQVPEGKALWWKNCQNKGPNQGGSGKGMFWIFMMPSFENFIQHKVHTNSHVGWKNVTSQWKNKRNHKKKWKTKKSIWKLEFPSNIVRGKLLIIVPTLISIFFYANVLRSFELFLGVFIKGGDISKIKPKFHYKIILSYLFWK